MKYKRPRFSNAAILLVFVFLLVVATFVGAFFGAYFGSIGWSDFMNRFGG